jgi:hypothetical protein
MSIMGITTTLPAGRAAKHGQALEVIDCHTWRVASAEQVRGGRRWALSIGLASLVRPHLGLHDVARAGASVAVTHADRRLHQDAGDDSGMSERLCLRVDISATGQ